MSRLKVQLVGVVVASVVGLVYISKTANHKSSMEVAIDNLALAEKESCFGLANQYRLAYNSKMEVESKLKEAKGESSMFMGPTGNLNYGYQLCLEDKALMQINKKQLNTK